MNQEVRYDAIVVGRGISGSWAAKELCENGLKSLVLGLTAKKIVPIFNIVGKISLTIYSFLIFVVFEGPIQNPIYATFRNFSHLIKKSAMKKILFAVTLLGPLLESCSNETTDNASLNSVCNQITIVDNSLFTNAQTEDYTINSIQVVDDCLEVQIQSSGCSGDTWKVDLIDSGNVAESNPEQRYLKISFTSTELCDAVISKAFSFDLSPLRISSPSIFLNLNLWDEQIPYTY